MICDAGKPLSAPGECHTRAFARVFAGAGTNITTTAIADTDPLERPVHANKVGAQKGGVQGPRRRVLLRGVAALHEADPIGSRAV